MNGDGYDDLAAYVFNSAATTDNSVVMQSAGWRSIARTRRSGPSLSTATRAFFERRCRLRREDGFADLLIVYGAEVEADPVTASIRFLSGGTDETLTPLQVGDFGATASNLSQVASGDYDGDGHRDLVAGSATTSLAERRRLGKAMTESQNCSQPESPFPESAIGVRQRPFTATAASPLENYLGVFVR